MHPSSKKTSGWLQCCRCRPSRFLTPSLCNLRLCRAVPHPKPPNPANCRSSDRPTEVAVQPSLRREVTRHDWYGASRSANARRALVPRTEVSPECRVRGGRAQQYGRKSHVYATTPETRSAGSRGDGKTRGREC